MKPLGTKPTTALALLLLYRLNELISHLLFSITLAALPHSQSGYLRPSAGFGASTVVLLLAVRDQQRESEEGKIESRDPGSRSSCIINYGDSRRLCPVLTTCQAMWLRLIYGFSYFRLLRILSGQLRKLRLRDI